MVLWSLGWNLIYKKNFHYFAAIKFQIAKEQQQKQQQKGAKTFFFSSSFWNSIITQKVTEFYTFAPKLTKKEPQIVFGKSHTHDDL